eukprot:TRINITY_DN5759_c0_g1_i1.p1 TRINITY_DN5759_c0_g1~~TRINITY_DN5759_c0_g1_i1.p1  ORF type:complete len:1044 (+),score=353.50 TRINITY_DN5759_c0_g1_i1:154-3132(+)
MAVAPAAASPTRDRSALPDHRLREMTENQKRVHRAKLEKKFLSDIASQRHKGKLSDYRSLQADAETHGRITLDLKNPVSEHGRLMIDKARARESAARTKTGVFEPIRCVHEFAGPIRCLEAAQGSSTLWTGSEDGTLTIRNGETGEVVHCLPGTGGLHADSLFATDTHMWVGMNDGTLRIYDSLVYILVLVTTYHSDSITCFCSTFDGKVFSGGLDGNLIKWDTEANGFAVMNRWEPESCPKIRCMACYGYNLFIGGDDAVITSIDTESGAMQRTFRDHTGLVAALLVQDGFLFSASHDTTVRAWDIESGECIFPLGTTHGSTQVGHTSAVTSLIGDPVAHRIWSSDSSGIVHVWESMSESDFKHLYEITDHAGEGGIISLKNYATVDAVKMWSVSSKGKNRVWYSAVNKGEDATNATIVSMESIISADTAQLENWKELVGRLEGIDAERKRKLAGVLGGNTDEGILHGRWLQWRKFLLFKQRARRFEQTAGVLMANTDRGLLFQKYQRWKAFFARGYDLRRKQAVANLLLSQTRRGLMLLYWKKVRAYALLQKKRLRQARAAEVLLNTNESGMRRVAWRRLLRFTDGAARRRKRVAAAEALMMGTDRGRLRVYYIRLMQFKKWKQARERRFGLWETLNRSTQTGLLRVYYLKWLHFPQIRRRRRQRLLWASSLGETTGQSLRTQAYGKLMDWRRIQHIRKKREGIEEEGARKEKLKKDYDEKSVILRRLSVLEAKKAELAEIKARLKEVQDEGAKKRADMAEMREQIHDRQQGRAEREEKARQEMVEDFMALLKARVLNYHRDYSLIEKTRDQVHPRGQLPVQKLFLESHMAVKRVVIEVTKHKIETGARWTALKGKRDKDIPDHQKMTILHAIKVMIICYDLMPQDVRDSLETDDEILMNTEYLETLATIGKREEDKRRGVNPDGSPRRRSRSRQGSRGGSQTRSASGSRRRSRSRRSRSEGGSSAAGSPAPTREPAAAAASPAGDEGDA